VRTSRSRSSTATALKLTCATDYRSSSEIVWPSRARSMPRSARSYAPDMPSSSVAMLRASGSASSIAVESSDRASVPSCTCVRSASRVKRAAYSGSSVTFNLWADPSTRLILHYSARIVYKVYARAAGPSPSSPLGARRVLHQLQPPTATTGTTNIPDTYQCIAQASTTIVALRYHARPACIHPLGLAAPRPAQALLYGPSGIALDAPPEG
jgi:hypothetical protein